MKPNEKKDWIKKLKNIKNYSEAAKESEQLGGTVPDGSYEAVVKSAKLGQSQNGRDQIIIGMEIQNDDEQEGSKIATFPGLDDNSMKFTLAMLRRLGFEIAGDDPSELIDIVDQLNSSGMSVQIKVKDGFCNILNSNEDPHIAGEDEGSEDEEAEESEDDTDGDEDGDDSAEESEEDEDSEDSETEEESEESAPEVAEGVQVTWKGEDKKVKNGEVIEVIEDKNLARVELADGKIVRVNIEKLTVVPKDGEEEENGEDSEEDSEEDSSEEVEVKPRAKAKKVTKVAPVAKKKTAKRRK